ncbi:MAG: tetratricopeptide repeat protein [Acidobacteriota bacterium]|nr:tetratricopeptide repeat protein [Acidobacteriota bacterium]
MRDNFLPVRIHVRDEGAAAWMEKFGAQWTPTTLLLDSNGVERHRIEGFLPASDFAAQILLGMGHAARAAGDFREAERRYGEVLDKFPDSDAAAEAQYWKGVSRYKATNDASALADTARAFQSRYADSSWAKKASVWGQGQA